MKGFVPWLAVIIGLLVIATAFRQCRQRGAANYQTATITRGPITQAVTATGTLNPVVNVQVGSQVSGNIAKLFVDFNSEVKAGQVVAQIDPVLFQATVTHRSCDVEFGRRRDWDHLWHWRVADFINVRALANADFDQLDRDCIFVQRGGWNFLWLLSGAQSRCARSHRSASVRVNQVAA